MKTNIVYSNISFSLGKFINKQFNDLIVVIWICNLPCVVLYNFIIKRCYLQTRFYFDIATVAYSNQVQSSQVKFIMPIWTFIVPKAFFWHTVTRVANSLKGWKEQRMWVAGRVLDGVTRSLSFCYFEDIIKSLITTKSPGCIIILTNLCHCVH